MDNSPVEIIFRWDSEDVRQKMIFDGDRQEAERYLQAVDEIQRSGDQSAVSIAMARLENEFRNILTSRTKPISVLPHLNTKEEDEVVVEEEEPKQGCACFCCLRFKSSASAKRHDDDDDYYYYDDCRLLYFGRFDETSVHCFSVDAINDLRCIAERMISSGYLWQCIQVYGTVRKSNIDAILGSLGISDVGAPLEARIHRWREAAMVCVLKLFAREKRLCEKIFDGVGPDIAHASFIETAKESAIQLLNFADTTCTTLMSLPYKLLMILDLYNALADLIPHLDNAFGLKSCESIRVLARNVLSRLSEAAMGSLSAFENALLRDTAKAPVPASGTIHPLTWCVIDDLRLICDNKKILNRLIVSKPSMESIFNVDLAHIIEEEGKTPLGVHLIWIIEILQIHLDGKAKQYKDKSLSHLFIMNNVHFIFDWMRALKEHSELRDMIGDGYLEKLERKFQQAAISYEKSTWGRVLNCLTDEGLYLKIGCKMSISKSALRKKIKAFNALFEKIHRTQAVWSIPDSQLRKSLRMSITEKLIPAYTSLVGQCGSINLNGRYVEYSELELQAAVLELFKGKPIS
ncbi:exocyst complex component EXO70B1-like [Abrus precatorius]|uniref:Exocyst subunit Exo70 family protein n=1 Tax=Abrus precatorius TaxID=3816 RepID=A0A8B8KLW1_ABRPR|nr:exocyst complex component EXO70B1-like [Abrus precatorius]